MFKEKIFDVQKKLIQDLKPTFDVEDFRNVIWTLKWKCLYKCYVSECLRFMYTRRRQKKTIWIKRRKENIVSYCIPSVGYCWGWKEIDNCSSSSVFSNGMGSSEKSFCSLFVVKRLPWCLESVAELRHKAELLRFQVRRLWVSLN